MRQRVQQVVPQLRRGRRTAAGGHLAVRDSHEAPPLHCCMAAQHTCTCTCTCPALPPTHRAPRVSPAHQRPPCGTGRPQRACCGLSASAERPTKNVQYAANLAALERLVLYRFTKDDMGEGRRGVGGGGWGPRVRAVGGGAVPAACVWSACGVHAVRP